FIPAVMMKIPGKNGRNLNVFVFMGIVFFFSTQNMINKELDPAVGIVFMIERFIHPRRLGSAKDNFIIGFKFILSNFFKVTQLRIINICIQLHVNSQQPAVVWKFKGKIASTLFRMPVSQRSALTK